MRSESPFQSLLRQETSTRDRGRLFPSSRESVLSATSNFFRLSRASSSQSRKNHAGWVSPFHASNAAASTASIAENSLPSASCSIVQ